MPLVGQGFPQMLEAAADRRLSGGYEVSAPPPQKQKNEEADRKPHIPDSEVRMDDEKHICVPDGT